MPCTAETISGPLHCLPPVLLAECGGSNHGLVKPRGASSASMSSAHGHLRAPVRVLNTAVKLASDIWPESGILVSSGTRRRGCWRNRHADLRTSPDAAILRW